MVLIIKFDKALSIKRRVFVFYISFFPVIAAGTGSP